MLKVTRVKSFLEPKRQNYRLRMDAPMIPAATATIISIKIQLASRKVAIALDEGAKNIVTAEGSALMVNTPFV